MPMQLPAAASIDQASALLTLLEAALAEAGVGEFVVDASALTDFDSSTLALLLETQRRVQGAGGRLLVRGAPAKLRELAGLYGIDELLPLQAEGG